MANKIEITEKQAKQFNVMLGVLKSISKGYLTPNQMRKGAKDFGLDFEEALEMAYENIQHEAKSAISNVKPI